MDRRQPLHIYWCKPCLLAARRWCQEVEARWSKAYREVEAEEC